LSNTPVGQEEIQVPHRLHRERKVSSSGLPGGLINSSCGLVASYVNSAAALANEFARALKNFLLLIPFPFRFLVGYKEYKYCYSCKCGNDIQVFVYKGYDAFSEFPY